MALPKKTSKPRRLLNQSHLLNEASHQILEYPRSLFKISFWKTMRHTILFRNCCSWKLRLSQNQALRNWNWGSRQLWQSIVRCQYLIYQLLKANWACGKVQPRSTGVTPWKWLNVLWHRNCWNLKLWSRSETMINHGFTYPLHRGCRTHSTWSRISNRFRKNVGLDA